MDRLTGGCSPHRAGSRVDRSGRADPRHRLRPRLRLHHLPPRRLRGTRTEDDRHRPGRTDRAPRLPADEGLLLPVPPRNHRLQRDGQLLYETGRRSARVRDGGDARGRGDSDGAFARRQGRPRRRGRSRDGRAGLRTRRYARPQRHGPAAGRRECGRGPLPRRPAGANPRGGSHPLSGRGRG